MKKTFNLIFLFLIFIFLVNMISNVVSAQDAGLEIKAKHPGEENNKTLTVERIEIESIDQGVDQSLTTTEIVFIVIGILVIIVIVWKLLQKTQKIVHK